MTAKKTKTAKPATAPAPRTPPPFAPRGGPVAHPAASTSPVPRVESHNASARQPRGPAIRVEATQLGYYADTRRRIGDVFDIAAEADFSKIWMRRVSGSTPTRITLGNQAIAQEHDEILSLRQAGARRAPTGNEDVLGD